MKILLLGDCNNPHTRKWCDALLGRGHDVHLFSFTRFDNGSIQCVPAGQFWTLDLDPEFPKRAGGAAKILSYFRGIPAVARLVSSLKPDIVNAHFASSYGFVAAMAHVSPLLISVWGYDIYDWPKKSRLHRYVMSRILNSAARVLSTSAAMADVTLAYTRRPILVTPFGVDTSIFRPLRTETRRSSKERFDIGTVKTLEDKYGIEYLIRAFCFIREEQSARAVHLHIYGDGSLRSQLESMVRDMGIESDVTFYGRVDHATVPQAFSTMDVAVFPSIHDSESFGVAAIEAQACGLPVVASRVGGLPETIVEHRTGLLVPPRDPRALADAILALREASELRLEMGSAARDHVVAKYDLEFCIDVMESAYESVWKGTDAD